MILNQRHRFVFIHIPKCGGTTIRNVLEEHNEWPQFTHPKTREIPTHGIVDHAHIPLFTLKELYPEDFDQLCSFESFALVRNPFDRFFSSVLQKMRMDKMREKSKIRTFSNIEIQNEIQAMVAYLSDLPYSYQLLPYNYVYFQRQVDYIYLNDERVVKHIYCLNNLDSFFAAIEEKTCVKLPKFKEPVSESVSNRSELYRNDVLKWIDVTMKPVRSLLGSVTPFQVRKMYKQVTKVPTSSTYDAFMNPSVKQCIETYYKKDIELYHKICSGASQSSA
jgi:hypothetical protein